MDDLLPVNIVQGVADLAYDLLAEPAVDCAGSDEFFESASVYPFHYYAVAYSGVGDLCVVLAYSAVAEGKTYVEVLVKEVFVKQIASEFFL